MSTENPKDPEEKGRDGVDDAAQKATQSSVTPSTSAPDEAGTAPAGQSPEYAHAGTFPVGHPSKEAPGVITDTPRTGALQPGAAEARLFERRKNNSYCCFS